MLNDGKVNKKNAYNLPEITIFQAKVVLVLEMVLFLQQNML
jgi:hypothetical protein